MEKLIDRKWFQLSLPFVVYMIFVFIQEMIAKVIGADRAIDLVPILYPVKIAAVIAVLAVFWKSYGEIRVDRLQWLHVLAATGTGILVFVLWINMDWEFATLSGKPSSFNPHSLTGIWLPLFLIARLLGASVVVPIIEELFWRSFILRYIIKPDFTEVQIGAFTWPSFLISSALFGLEHNLWLAGIVASMLYNLLLYRTRHLFYCILAHGLTNLLLGIYVIKTGNWQFW
jgi:CAAX prenyl protease-like protein